MNAQWNWLKTVLALMFFLCTLFLMPERARPSRFRRRVSRRAAARPMMTPVSRIGMGGGQ